MFPYMVDASKATGGGAVPAFVWNSFDPDAKSFEIPSCGNVQVIPLPVVHGMYHSGARAAQPYICLGFRIGDMSYIGDVNAVPPETKAKMDGTRILIVDALRKAPHPSHFGFDEVESPENQLIIGQRIYVITESCS
jgi:phosphoribosyl 1,2-cyclic phosphodiesterase